jgi:hypothetical protein
MRIPVWWLILVVHLIGLSYRRRFSKNAPLGESVRMFQIWFDHESSELMNDLIHWIEVLEVVEVWKVMPGWRKWVHGIVPLKGVSWS